MTDEEAKELGLRALKLGLQWASGLMDGHERDRADYISKSWPDFRDPVTEAWLVAWAIKEVSRKGLAVDITCADSSPSGLWWLDLTNDELVLECCAETEVEVWLQALEAFRGDGRA